MFPLYSPAAKTTGCICALLQDGEWKSVSRSRQHFKVPFVGSNALSSILLPLTIMSDSEMVDERNEIECDFGTTSLLSCFLDSSVSASSLLPSIHDSIISSLNLYWSRRFFLSVFQIIIWAEWYKRYVLTSSTCNPHIQMDHHHLRSHIQWSK